MENFRIINCPEETHKHEVQGSVRIAEQGCDAHNHRFATVSGRAIQMGQSHVHEVEFDTDTYEGHWHEFCGRTTTAYPVGDGHVHYLESVTAPRDGHCHTFKVITHIEDPIED